MFNVLDSAIGYPFGSTTLDPRVDTTRITLGESLIFEGIRDVTGVLRQRCTVGGGQGPRPIVIAAMVVICPIDDATPRSLRE